jgi:hypothetical protein
VSRFDVAAEPLIKHLIGTGQVDDLPVWER